MVANILETYVKSTRQTYIRQAHNTHMATKQDSELWNRLVEATPSMEAKDRSPYFEKVCGVSQASTSRWRTGENDLSLNNAKAISRATGYCVQYLIDSTGPRRWNLQDEDIDRLVAILDSAGPEDKEDILKYAAFRTGDN